MKNRFQWEVYHYSDSEEHSLTTPNFKIVISNLPSKTTCESCHWVYAIHSSFSSLEFIPLESETIEGAKREAIQGTAEAVNREVENLRARTTQMLEHVAVLLLTGD